MGRFTWSLVAAATALVGAGIATAAPATADNASYLAALGDRVQSRNGPDGLLAAGKESCRLLAPNSYLMLVGRRRWCLA
ncbi:DUF732 domain-containing protein [Mycobacterium yunnanensis]|uniref:DUF732 domain-containing protein n=1 Tax=Mycobacterium yunnanensis TaxID=368477 RepID=A0A9X2ZA53_9MYCO|nr:hypothetical protein [Mycobacterium yunnanensis]MCV7424395.1 DUF732 domain-containing protein [Mycobacterium yunnanensis]